MAAITSLSGQAALAVDTAFQGKIRICMVVAAKDIMGEAKGEMSDTKYGKRQQLAYEIASSGGNKYLDAFCWGAASNGGMDAEIDGDVQFTVNSMFDDIAGVRGNE